MKHLNKILLLFAVLLASCSKDDDNPTTPNPQTVDTSASRTVIMYIVANNNISTFLNADVKEVISGVKAAQNMTANDQLILLYNTYSSSDVYALTKESVKDVNSLADLTPVFSYEKSTNILSKEDMRNVLDDIYDVYPADSYSIVFESHGSGWIISNTSASAKPRRSFGDNGGKKMDITDLAEVLKKPIKEGQTHKNFDYIFFDACFMQGIEVDYQLRDCADYIVASPAEIPADGADYTKMVDLFFTPGLEGANKLAQQYVDSYLLQQAGPLLSVVNTSKIETFAQYMKGMVEKYHDTLMEDSYPVDDNYFVYAHMDRSKYSFPDYLDLMNIMTTILPASELTEFKKQLDEIIETNPHSKAWVTQYGYMNSTTRYVNDELYSGISMFIPFLKYNASSTSLSWNSTIHNVEWGQLVWANY